ncbi:MAG: hypothetical protein J5I90_10880 [Caldilineales bacterium]|nr:hypothetical protein [Caldilineales bacterium]
MIHESDLRELVEFDGQDYGVLSLYLNVDPRQVSMDQYRLSLRNLLNGNNNVDPADRERVERYFDLEYERKSRGVVCFSCQELGFWRTYTFNVPVEDAIMVDRRPLVRRLVELFETYGNFGVVAIDKLGGRFFTFNMGVLEEASGIVGEDVKRHKQGGWAASRYQRHEDEAAMSNLRAVAELTEQYARQYEWRRLVLAGTDGNVAHFQTLLPQHIQKLIVGTTPLELTADTQEVRERAESVAFAARAQYHQQLAEDLLVAAGKGGPAVVGLGSTLDALQGGRVQQLLLTDSYEVAEDHVQRCTICNFLSVEPNGVCPVCSSATEPLPDAINTVARRAIAQQAEVIILPADNPLVERGYQVGAYLRF